MGRRTEEWLDRFLDLADRDPEWSRGETSRLGWVLVNLGSPATISERLDAESDEGRRRQLRHLLIQKS